MNDYIFLNPAPISYPTTISMIEDIVETILTKSRVAYTSMDMKLELDVRIRKLVLLANDF